jgi:hypothetical protein
MVVQKLMNLLCIFPDEAPCLFVGNPSIIHPGLMVPTEFRRIGKKVKIGLLWMNKNSEGRGSFKLF